jgi:hypothetical protein
VLDQETTAIIIRSGSMRRGTIGNHHHSRLCRAVRAANVTAPVTANHTARWTLPIKNEEHSSPLRRLPVISL